MQIRGIKYLYPYIRNANTDNKLYFKQNLKNGDI